MLISSSQQQKSKEKMENLEDSDDNGYDESNAIFLKGNGTTISNSF